MREIALKRLPATRFDTQKDLIKNTNNMANPFVLSFIAYLTLDYILYEAMKAHCFFDSVVVHQRISPQYPYCFHKGNIIFCYWMVSFRERKITSKKKLFRNVISVEKCTHT